MTKELEEYRTTVHDALIGHGTRVDIFNAAQALLRVIDALGEEKDEDRDTNVGMLSLGRVRGHNDLRQQIIDAILEDK